MLRVAHLSRNATGRTRWWPQPRRRFIHPETRAQCIGRKLLQTDLARPKIINPKYIFFSSSIKSLICKSCENIKIKKNRTYAFFHEFSSKSPTTHGLREVRGFSISGDAQHWTKTNYIYFVSNQQFIVLYSHSIFIKQPKRPFLYHFLSCTGDKRRRNSHDTPVLSSNKKNYFTASWILILVVFIFF